MTKYKAIIEYNGSKFYGFQRLKDKDTVQNRIEKALTKINEVQSEIKAASRTDRGVHAKGQVITFDILKDTNPYKLKFYLNNELNPDIYVKELEITDINFHPRFSVISKEYEYVINCLDFNSIQNDYLYNYNKKLDTSKMKDIASILMGPHSYKAFVCGKHKTYDSIVELINIVDIDGIIHIYIKGKAFYTYMIRNIVRILIMYSENNITLDEVNEMLSSGNRVKEYSPVPASGLYLNKINY